MSSRAKYFSVSVKCPFFVAREPCGIHCAGLSDNMTTHFVFHTNDSKRIYSARYCERSYTDCPYYKTMDALYDENGNRS